MTVNSYALEFVRSFLTQRRQRVISSDGKPTDFVDVTSGVPQGSVIGPFLFAIVVNSFRPVNENTCVIAYADDLTILCPESNNENEVTQIEASNIYNWSLNHGLEINLAKTVVLPLSRRTINAEPCIFVNHRILKVVHSTKILGVVLDSNLKWNGHVSYLKSKCSQAMFGIRSLHRSGCSDDTMIDAFNALVFSRLQFAWPVFCDISASQMKSVLSFEKTINRFCRKKSKNSIKAKLDRSCLKLMQSIILDFDNHRLSKFFTRRQVSTYSLREQRSLLPVCWKTALSRNSFLKFYSKFSF